MTYVRAAIRKDNRRQKGRGGSARFRLTGPRGRQWFSTAQEALEERNSVLHSVPATLIHISSDGAVTTHGEVLDHIPSRKSGSFRQTSLTEEELRRIRQKLADARAGWVDLCDALIHDQPLTHKSDP